MGSIPTPPFTVADIQTGVGDWEFTKALALYTKGAVTGIKKVFSGFTATVSGTHEYEVRVDSSAYDRGNCTCYIGQKDELCKHMLSLAIALVYKYRPNDTKMIEQPLDQAVCSGDVRNMTKEESDTAKKEISTALTFIKSYNGPSSRWFYYQDALAKGSRLVLLALSNIPICKDSVMLCIHTLKKLDKKVLRGVDDSDGTVGELMCEIVELLNMFVSSDTALKDYIAKKLPKGESFDWEAGFGL